MTSRRTTTLPFLLILLLIVAGSGVVAISAKELRLILPPLELAGSWVLGIRLLGGAAVVIGLAFLVWRRDPHPGRGRRTPGSMADALRGAAIIMAFLAALAYLVHPLPGPEEATGPEVAMSPGEPEPPEPGGAEASSPSGLPGGRGGGAGGAGGGGVSGPPELVPAGESQPQLSLLEQVQRNLPLLLLALLAVAALFVLRRYLGPGPGAMQAELLVGPEEAEAGLEASLREVAWEGGEPSQQVSAAYLRLLAVLSRAGAGRLVQEAPHEHLFRVLGPLGVRPGPLHRLAALHVMARFSRRSVTDDHRAAAAEALEASLEELRKSESYRKAREEAAGGPESGSHDPSAPPRDPDPAEAMA